MVPFSTFFSSTMHLTDPIVTQNLVRTFDLFGTSVFAISGVLLAGRLRMDAFGVIVLATVTAVGGGTIRDTVLGATPVFWITDPWYLWVILITVVLCLWLMRLPKRLPWYLFPLADAIGLAVFTIIGVQKALHYSHDPLIAILMGVLTGVGGGMIRDVLARQIPMVLQKEIYATASIFGGILYFLALKVGVTGVIALWVAVCGTLALRTAAIFKHLSLPTFSLKRH